MLSHLGRKLKSLSPSLNNKFIVAIVRVLRVGFQAIIAQGKCSDSDNSASISLSINYYPSFAIALLYYIICGYT